MSTTDLLANIKGLEIHSSRRTYLKNVLVRIDPKDARVEVVGKIDPVGWPTFASSDLYLAGSEQLRRIRNIVR